MMLNWPRIRHIGGRKALFYTLFLPFLLIPLNPDEEEKFLGYVGGKPCTRIETLSRALHLLMEGEDGYLLYNLTGEVSHCKREWLHSPVSFHPSPGGALPLSRGTELPPSRLR